MKLPQNNMVHIHNIEASYKGKLHIPHTVTQGENMWATNHDPGSLISEKCMQISQGNIACAPSDDLVYRFRKIVGKSNFSEQFRKLINRHKRIGYSLDIMRQTACLVVNPIIVDGYASLFNCTTAVRASDPMTASS